MGKSLVYKRFCMTPVWAFKFRVFFPPIHKSAENNTWSWSCDCTPQVLVWVWKVTVCTTNSDKRNVSSHRSRLTPFGTWREQKKRKKEILSEAVQIQFQTVQFFSFTSFQTNIPENFQSFPRAIYRIGKKNPWNCKGKAGVWKPSSIPRNFFSSLHNFSK